MDEFKFITKEDLQNSVNLFYKVPMRSRNVIANKIHTRLKELDEYVNVWLEGTDVFGIAGVIIDYSFEKINKINNSNDYISF